jgi:hypothetical protein
MTPPDRMPQRTGLAGHVLVNTVSDVRRSRTRFPCRAHPTCRFCVAEAIPLLFWRVVRRPEKVWSIADLRTVGITTAWLPSAVLCALQSGQVASVLVPVAAYGTTHGSLEYLTPHEFGALQSINTQAKTLVTVGQ